MDAVIVFTQILVTSQAKRKETKKERESQKKTIIKNKKEDIKIKVKRFNEDNTSKLVIII